MKKRVKILISLLTVAILLAVCALAVFASTTTVAQRLLLGIAKTPPTLSADGKSIILPTVSDSSYKVELYGTSNTSVIDKDGNVFTPLVDTEVGVMYKVVSRTDASDFAVDEYKEAKIVIKGQYTPSAQDNKEPEVLPKLREWKGAQGFVSFTENSKILVLHPDFMTSATKAAEYIKAITGFNTQVVSTGTANPGDIVFDYTDAKELGKEGYTIELSDTVKISAYSATGALYGGTTIAQMLDSYENFALPRGYVRDYPQYEVRSIMLDVARYYIPMEDLEEFTKYMAYFKLNTMHVHINDSYGQQPYAFRIESKKYPEINANLNGNYYTQEEYRNYQKQMLDYGIKVITEIDSPGHAGFVAQYDPTLVVPENKTYINLSTAVHSTVGGVEYTYYDKSVEFMKGLFDEFLGGENPIIIDEVDTFHIGMDEYTWNHEQFKLYMKEMTDYVKSYGKKAQVWSSLQTADFSGELPIDNDVTVNYWGFADFEKHLEAGFPCVANNPMKLYVVPGGTNSFVDRLSLEALYPVYKVNVIQNEKLELAESSPLLRGAEAAFWNDVNVGVSVIDIFDRLHDQMLLVSEKAWYGNNAEGASVEEFLSRVHAFENSVPLVNPARFVKGDKNGNVAEYDFENTEGNTVKDKLGLYDAEISGLEVVKFGSSQMLRLDGSGYLTLPFDTLGNPFTASFELIYEGSENGVLFESPDGKLVINHNGMGKIAYSRDMMTYTFSHVFSEGVQYNIKIVSDENNCYLYVNGVFDSKGTIYSMETADKIASRIKFTSFALPTEKIGAGVVGYIDNIKLSNYAEDHDTLSGLSYVNYGNVALGKDVTASGVEVSTKWGPECAVDGIKSSADMDNKTSLNNSDDAWLVIDLGKEYEIDKIVIEFAQRPAKYEILLSTDGITYVKAFEEYEKTGGARGTDTISLEGKKARYVKYQTVEMFLATNNHYYSGNFHEIEVYSTEINTEIIDKANSIIDTLENDEREFLENAIELVEYIIANNDFNDAGIALKCLDDLTEELSAGLTLTSNADRSLIAELIKNKTPAASYSEDSYAAYQYEYKFAIGMALDLTATEAAIKEYAERIERAALGLIGPASIETDMNFDSPENMLDSNESTFATTSSNQAAGNYIVLKYQDGITLKSLKFVMTVGGKCLAPSNLYVSYDGTNFVPVTTYNMTSFTVTPLVIGDSLAAKNEVFFPTPLMNVKAIKVSVNESAAKLLQINEISINHVTDFDSIVPGITSLDSELYTKDSFKYMLPFASGMATTRFYMNSAPTYMKYLVRRADKAVIEEEIERLSGINPELYTSSSYTKLTNAINQAKSFIAGINENTNIYDADKVLLSLSEKEAKLIKKASGVDSSLLEEALSRELSSKDYTYYSFKAYANAVNEAYELLSEENLTQEKVNAALIKLERIYSNLEARKSVENVALGKEVSVSGLEAGNSKTKAEFATDGIESGTDFRVCLNSSDDAWLVIDLGKEYVIDKIDVLWCRKSAAFRMLVSEDGIKWNTVYEDLSGKNMGASVNDTIEIAEGIKARYVKFEQVLSFFGNVEKNYRYCGTFYEIKVTAADMTPYTSELEYAYANTCDTSLLHPNCKEKYEAALAEAERVLSLEAPTQEEIDAAASALAHHSELNFTTDDDFHSFECSCGFSVSGEHDWNLKGEDEGGNPVYVCSVCKKEVTRSSSKLLATQLVLDESINMNYIFSVGGEFDSVSVIFEFLGKEYEGEFVEINSDGNYVFRFSGIRPQYMTDVLLAKIIVKDGDKEISTNCGGESVKSYIAKVLDEHKDDEALVTLASDLLVYGREAQLYVGYKTDNLATEGVSISPSESFEKPESIRSLSTGNSSCSFLTVGLNLKGDVNMYFTFKADTLDGLTLKLSINGREAYFDKSSFESLGNGEYKLYFSGIMAHEFDDAVVAEFYIDGEATGTSLTYSVNSYVKESNTGRTSPEAMLIRALSKYGNSATKYREGGSK